MVSAMTALDRFHAFVVEREAVRVRRALGQPQESWTQDPILRAYRFCCVRREHDAVTRWIDINWRTPRQNDSDLWFAMVLARLINEPSTLGAIGYPDVWDPQHLISVIRRRKADGVRWINPAYIVSTAGQPVPKEVYIADVLSDMWPARAILRPRSGDTLNSYHTLLMLRPGLGSFLAAQVVADLKYVAPLKDAADWMTFAASGPGSRRGLNRVLERPVRSPWTEDNWRLETARVQEHLNDLLRWDQPLHAQDVQNCFCEFDKYERARLGEGRPKQKFTWDGNR